MHPAAVLLIGNGFEHVIVNTVGRGNAVLQGSPMFEWASIGGDCYKELCKSAIRNLDYTN